MESGFRTVQVPYHDIKNDKINIPIVYLDESFKLPVVRTAHKVKKNALCAGTRRYQSIDLLN